MDKISAQQLPGVYVSILFLFHYPALLVPGATGHDCIPVESLPSCFHVMRGRMSPDAISAMGGRGSDEMGMTESPINILFH